MHKLYCYVDESGQDTTAQPGRERVFIVAVAIFAQSIPPQKPDFDAATIFSIAQAIRWKHPSQDYTSDIFIDGISETKQTQYARELRRLGIQVRRVQRARDESHALIRLADALAGLAREAAEGQNQDSVNLLRRAIRRGIVSEV